MNIAFMIGNGFDLSLGLKTKYTDFYEYYFNKKDKSDNEIMKEIKKDIEKNNKKGIELWSDLEKALGEYTNKLKLKDDALDKFYNDKYNLDCELREYLKKEQDRIDWDNSQNKVSVGKEFIYGLSRFYLKFNEVDRTDIMSVIPNETCYYNLISFHLTILMLFKKLWSILEQII